MRRALLFLAVAAGVLGPARGAAAEPAWIRVATPHFELYTSGSENRSRETILHFEQVRAFFLKTSPAFRLPEERIRILGFRSEREYRPFSPREGARAYFTSGPRGNAIVMQGLDSTYRPAAVHEFVHLLVSVAKAKEPLWLNEGLAQLYETLMPLSRTSVRVGGIPEGRLRILAEKKWLDLDDLLAAGHDSRYYSDPNLTSLFYSESWALTHMLMLSDKYRPKGPAFLDAVFGGQDSAEAIPAIYGQTLRQVREDLELYARNTAFRVLVFPFGLEKSAEQPEIRPATPLEWGMVQADVLANTANRRAEAKRSYEKLAASFPESWQPAAGLAYLALVAGDREEARLQFARAEERGCDDPRVYLDYSHLVLGSSQAAELSARLLRKALELKPSGQEMFYQLAMALYQAREYRSALDMMGRLKSITPERAPDLFLAMADCAHFAGSDQAAKEAAERALKEARNDEQRSAAQARLDYFSRPTPRQPVPATVFSEVSSGPAAGETEEPEPGPQPLRRQERGPVERPGVPPLPRAEGVLFQVDCLGDGARVWLRSGEKKLGFLIAKSDEVIILRGGETVVHEFECGPQKTQEKVVVDFESKPDTGQGVEGVLKRLEFR